jgi:hypothetical protein
MRRIVVVVLVLVVSAVAAPAGASSSSACTRALDAADDMIELQTDTVHDAAEVKAQVGAALTGSFGEMVARIRAASDEMSARAAARQAPLERAGTRYVRWSRACRRA